MINYRTGRPMTTYPRILDRMHVIGRMIAMCDRMIAENNDVQTAEFHKAKYNDEASALQEKMAHFPIKLATPQLRYSPDFPPFTHCRIYENYAGFVIEATPDFESYIHLTTTRTLKDAMGFVNA